MEKHIRLMTPALGALVLLYAVYGITIRHQGRNAESQALSPENASVYMTDLPGLFSLSQTKDDKSLPFIREGGTWYYKGDTDRLARQYPLIIPSDALSHLEAERKLEGADSSEAYGLDNPSVRFDTVSSDGSSHSILVGSQAPGTGGPDPDGSQLLAQYYAAMDGDSQIYTIGSYLTETAAKGFYDSVETESLPHVAGADIREIAVSRNGQTRWFYKKIVDDVGNIAWYRGSDADEANRLDDNGALNNLVDVISGLSFQSCIPYKVSDGELGSYGLSEPVMTLSWTYESGDRDSAISLAIGNSTEDGTGYYTRKDGSRAVNLMPKEAVERRFNVAYPR